MLDRNHLLHCEFGIVFRYHYRSNRISRKSLKLCKYQLENIGDRRKLLAILCGLATVSAITRSKTLANEVGILVRRYRHDSQYTLSIEESMNIILISAASHSDLYGWREFVGSWLTELAFSKLEGDDSDVLNSFLQYLYQIVPELWISCGRAVAAIKAYNFRLNKSTKTSLYIIPISQSCRIQGIIIKDLTRN